MEKAAEKIVIVLLAIALVRFVSVCIGRKQLVTDRTDEAENSVLRSIADFWKE